jgi:selenocysteine-specific elongation factor
MAKVILGTAGHIDHGKTALVKALTGVDTDRLKEEKARGITIELGFAELRGAGGQSFGVVDVPGHEGFVRTMVAGATGMDLVLLVVAADEGVMPQTREHLSIIELLDVRELVVAITKVDLVDEEWLALVDDDVAGLLAGTPYQNAHRVPVSSETGQGLDALRTALEDAASRAVRDRTSDLARLPVDRVFTVQGTGTVVTGTLWSGELSVDDRVRLLPGDKEARIRALQVHGQPVQRAAGGDRTAVALTGAGVDRARLRRGACLVTDEAWTESWMLTVRVRVLPDSSWSLEHNQRVRVHVGTGEALARVVLLDGPEAIEPGQAGWIQLRLEVPLAARCRDRVVLRSYSPLATLGGGQIAEPSPSKRRNLDAEGRAALTALLDSEPSHALAALLRTAAWRGVDATSLPVLLGLPPADCERALASAAAGHVTAGSRLFSDLVAEEGRALILAALDAEHRADSLRSEVPLSRLRPALPSWADSRLADALVQELAESGALELVGGGARRPGFVPAPTPDQEAACVALAKTYHDAGLSAPPVAELPDGLGTRGDIWSLLRWLEGQGTLRAIADGIYMDAPTLDDAIARIQEELGGRSGLGPTDFRDTLGVTRKYLIPLLNYLDGIGVTQRHDQLRSVAAP